MGMDKFSVVPRQRVLVETRVSLMIEFIPPHKRRPLWEARFETADD